MQEEVTNKTAALIVDGAKLTEHTFEKAVKKFLEEIQKSKQPKIYRGKQTLKQLAGQNAGLANIEIRIYFIFSSLLYFLWDSFLSHFFTSFLFLLYYEKVDIHTFVSVYFHFTAALISRIAMSLFCPGQQH